MSFLYNELLPEYIHLENECTNFLWDLITDSSNISSIILISSLSLISLIFLILIIIPLIFSKSESLVIWRIFLISGIISNYFCPFIYCYSLFNIFYKIRHQYSDPMMNTGTLIFMIIILMLFQLISFVFLMFIQELNSEYSMKASIVSARSRSTNQHFLLYSKYVYSSVSGIFSGLSVNIIIYIIVLGAFILIKQFMSVPEFYNSFTRRVY